MWRRKITILVPSVPIMSPSDTSSPLTFVSFADRKFDAGIFTSVLDGDNVLIDKVLCLCCMLMLFPLTLERNGTLFAS